MSDLVKANRDVGQTMFDEAARVSIAQLNPNAARIEDHHIQATVALIWPYSSSTRQLGLLLAERDVRLRKSKGQVKVTFHGGCAREVAQTKIGIGDYVRLGLRDVAWTRTGEEVSTPGKKVDWDLDISKTVSLEYSGQENATLTVNYTAESPPPERKSDPVALVGSSAANGFIKIQRTHALGPYFSPAGQYSRRSTSSSFIDASLDPFANDDGFVVGRGRKKTKFTRYSGSWHLLDGDEGTVATDDGDELPPSSSSSPLKTPSRVQLQIEEYNIPETQEPKPAEVAGGDVRDRDESLSIHSLKETIDTTNQDDGVEQSRTAADVVPQSGTDSQSTQPIPTPMGPPQVPSPSFRRDRPRTEIPISTVPTMTPTPILHPLPSPGLALVSPLVEHSGMSASYFPTTSFNESELDAISSYHENSVPITSAIAFNEHEINSAREEQLRGRFNIENSDVATTTGDGDQFLAVIENDGDRYPPALQDVVPSDVPLTSTSDDTIITPTISDFVDLDALQQHIDESALQTQITRQEDQREDEDMYGPPVNQSLNVIPSAIRPVYSLTSEPVVQPLSASSIHSNAMTYPYEIEFGNSLPGGMHVAQEDATQQLPSVLESPLVVERGEPEDVVHANTETDRQSEEASVFQNLSEAAPVALQPFYTEHHHTSLRKDGPNASDGTAEPLEDEADRDRARQQMDLNGSSESPPEVVDLLSSSSEPASPRSPAPDASASESKDVDESEGVWEESGPGLEPIQHILNPNDEGNQDELENDDLGQDGIRQNGINASEFNQQHVITPDATQIDAVSAESKTPSRIDTRVSLPPTPMLTQDRTESALESSPTAPQTTVTLEEPNQTSTPNSLSEESKSVRRATQRLTRRVVPSQIVTNEYFTPRRSARISQPSPSPTIATSPTAQQLSSPTRPRTRSRRSLSISVPEQGELFTTKSLQPSTPARGISTRLSYFPHLSTLGQYFNLEVDVIAICSSDSVPPQRAKSGPKDFHTTVLLRDESLAENSSPIRAQIFRPRKLALPTARRGDAILLRSMKAQTLDHKIMLLSTDTSAWAVFKSMPNDHLDIVVEGPPIEYEEAEQHVAERLMEWWHSRGKELHSDNLETSYNSEVQMATPASQRVTRSQRRKANATDQPDSTNELQTQESQFSPVQSTEGVDTQLVNTSSPAQSPTGRTSPTTPVRQSTHRRASSRRSESVVHELRDGTRYTTEEDGRGVNVLHELRDGTFYIDD